VLPEAGPVVAAALELELLELLLLPQAASAIAITGTLASTRMERLL
jgi:hypothetical protein